jgi:hypothetical protein
VTRGVVLGVTPGASRVRLPDGRTVVARNLLNQRTPLNAKVTLVSINSAWYVVGRSR